MIRSDLAAALDPSVLAARAGIDCDDWQRRFLLSPARQSLLCCSRQSGKSTAAAVLAVHEALYRAPALILACSPSERQSGEMLRRIKGLAALLRVPVAEESALRLELPNGSRIVALPGREATIRGFSGARLLVCDEAARVPDELMHAVRPMLAVSGGRLIALSTPWGKRGWFHAAWSDGGEAWARERVTAYECPRIDPGWLATERESLPAFIYRQEYECSFEESLSQAFSYSDVMGALDSSVTPLFGPGQFLTEERECQLSLPASI